jgi:hypothetical protein
MRYAFPFDVRSSLHINLRGRYMWDLCCSKEKPCLRKALQLSKFILQDIDDADYMVAATHNLVLHV